MKIKILIILIIVILIPLGIAIYQGSDNIARGEERFIQDKMAISKEQLSQYVDKISLSIDAIRIKYQSMLQNREIQLTEISKKEPTVRQSFYYSDNKLKYPNPKSNLSKKEHQFIERTDALWRDPTVFLKHDISKGERYSKLEKVAPISYGWFPWYWEEGIHLLFWQRNNGEIRGFEVERIALISSIISQMPESGDPNSRFEIQDNRDNPIYIWGDYITKDSEEITLSLALPQPLSSWKIKYITPKKEFTLSNNILYQYVLFGIILFILILFGLVYIYRDVTRDIREAEHRVTFVNQVSHELKTPLTNIRLYAEILSDRFDFEEEDSKEVSIILSESQRLSRMIANILTFAKQEKATLKLHFKFIDINLLINDILEQFKPSLNKKGISNIETDFNIKKEVSVDSDAIGQIIGNLISNVEKYAFSGEYLKLITKLEEHFLVISVIDRGIGISKELQKDIFRPFKRGSDSLTEGVSGAGIGLSISKELAELHSGNLSVKSSNKGTIFICKIKEMK